MTAVHRRHGRRGDSGRVAAWIVLACTLLCGLLLALATAGPATASEIRSGVRHAPRRASTTPSPNCVGIDTYTVSEEELTACGDGVAPLTSVTADPIVGDVVTDYNYDVYGRTDTLTVPSSSFDPLTYRISCWRGLACLTDLVRLTVLHTTRGSVAMGV